MIKKKYGVLIAPVLMLGLAACNNEDKTSMDTAYDNRQEVTDNYNGPMNVRNNNDMFGTDRNNNDRGMFDSDRDNFYDMTRDGDGNRRGDDMNISSMNTGMNSSQYPHTRAVLIQNAKYKYIMVNPNQASQWQRMLPPDVQRQIGQLPGQQQTQRPTEIMPPRATAPAPAPRQQAVPTPAPAPRQQAPAPKPAAPAPAPSTAKATAGISQAAQQVIDLTNAERRKNGLPALIGDAQLSGVATKKSQDMRIKNYFSHTSPTYGSPFDMMRDFGVSYKSAGENIAQGQQTPQQVVTAWMNSEGHRKNILSRNFTHIGVGYDPNGHYWTQMFIGK